MTALALALVLAAAGIHATWNFLLKRSGGGTVFIWLFAMLAAVIYAPLAVAIVWWKQPHIGWVAIALMAATAAFHTAYYMLLDRGYRSGDLSLVYPIARGSGPLITVLCAVVLLGERPSGLAIAGALLIACGAVALTGNLRALRDAGHHRAAGFALLTGCMIAGYTLVDKSAVDLFLVPPILQDWAGNMGRVMLMTPMVFKRKSEIMPVWHQKKRFIAAIAILCPLSYILVLTAMVFTPVSYVAPAREISILIGAVLGTRLLAEGQTRRRLTAAAAMVLGVIALAVG